MRCLEPQYPALEPEEMEAQQKKLKQVAAAGKREVQGGLGAERPFIADCLPREGLKPQAVTRC